MSLILEALKKSEAERQRGKAPGLFVEQAVLSPRRRRGTPAWVFGLGALLVAVAIGAAWWGWSRGAASEGVANVPGPKAVAPLPPAGVGPAEGASIPGARPLPVSPPPPTSPAPVAVPAPAPASAPTPIPRAPAATASTASTAAAPTVSAARSTPAETPDTGEGNYLPRLADLPAAERNALPPLNITMHVFADEPAQRFVILDGRRHGEGATPAGGLVIREIRRDGLVISFNGRDVLVPRP